MNMMTQCKLQERLFYSEFGGRTLVVQFMGGGLDQRGSV